MKTVVLATRNPHKVREIGEIFAGVGCRFVPVSEYDGAPVVEEDGDTLESNAVKKATAIAAHLQAWALADDTGLEVDALDGAPGVYSARYAGPEENADANCRKLLEALAGRSDRVARFRTVIALVAPNGVTRIVDGVCRGHIAEGHRGGNGFGYDPVFVPEGTDRSFAEMTPEEKNACSHRGRALRLALEAWGSLLMEP